jgi:uncharacterized protein YaiE (UPF0345 family)
MAGDKRLYAAYRGYKDTWTFTTTGTPSKQMTIQLWGATEWGQYNDGSGFFTGPAGDTVFPQGATLRGGYLSGSWMYLDFGSFSFSGEMNADKTQIVSGSYNVYAPSYSWGNFTGARTGHIPYWQTFLAQLNSTRQWISTYLGDNFSMGIGTNVEWKAPLSQMGNLSGLFIEPDTRLWLPGQPQGRSYRTGSQIGPTSTAQTI